MRWLLWKWREATLEHLEAQGHQSQPGAVRKGKLQLQKAAADEDVDEQHAKGAVPLDMIRDVSSAPDGLRQRILLSADSSNGTAMHTHAARTHADDVPASAPSPCARTKSPLQVR